MLYAPRAQCRTTRSAKEARQRRNNKLRSTRQLDTTRNKSLNVRDRAPSIKAALAPWARPPTTDEYRKPIRTMCRPEAQIREQRMPEMARCPSDSG